MTASVHELRSLVRARQIESASMWRRLHDAVEIAGDRFARKQQDMFEEEVRKRLAADSGWPLLLDSVMNIGLALLPWEGIVAYGLGRVITAGRWALGKVNVGKLGTAFVDLTAGGILRAADRETWLRLLAEHGQQVAQVTAKLKEPLGNELSRLAGVGIKAGLTGMRGPENVVKGRSAPEAPMVSVKRALWATIEASRVTEEKAWGAIELALESPEATEAVIQHCYDQLAEAPAGMDPSRHQRSFDELFERWVEAAMWSSTYDFSIQRVPPAYVVEPGLVRGMPPKLPGQEILPAFPDAVWDYLVREMMESYSAAKTYAEITAMGSTSERYRQEPDPRRRLARDFSQRGALLRRHNLGVCQGLRKALGAPQDGKAAAPREFANT